MEFSEEEKVRHSKYIVQVLLPFLKQINEDQRMEKEIEARTKGAFFLNSC